MRTIETYGLIDPDGRMSIDVPHDIRAGKHKVVIVIDEQLLRQKHSDPPQLPVFHVGAWPQDLSLRREDIYGDDGR